MSNDRDETTIRDQGLQRQGRTPTLRASLEQASESLITPELIQGMHENLTAQIDGSMSRMTGQSAPRPGVCEATPNETLEKIRRTPGASRPAMIHRIKSQNPHFEDLRSLRKKAELRVADRDYQVGDYLVLNHWMPSTRFVRPVIEGYTGNAEFRVITHVLKNPLGQPDDFVMLSVDTISKSDSTFDYLIANPEPEEVILERRHGLMRAAATELQKCPGIAERLMLPITKKVTYDLTKIYFGPTMHLAFVRRDVVGFQSWKSTWVYTLELTFRDGAAITTEYDDAIKWRRVIELIENDLTP